MSDSQGTSSTSASAGQSGNKLRTEKSPYLLQHKNNPVQWYSWGDEAFALAREKNLPIFLSVGYSTCHWCHVMERESFENESVAEVMNQNFVNVKMDREERPDIDRIYMTFVQAVSGSGGWPMSVWMTPDLKPFYGGTYYPPMDSFGRPGFRSLLLTIAEQWGENSQKFVKSADKILEVLHRTAMLPVTDKLPDSKEISKKCLQQLARSYEPAFGGFSDHPKFPQPVNLNFLLYHRKANPTNVESLQMADKTLRKMSQGGIHDHVGKGFCRYSTDKKWHVPHFEKMLYDNAQLAVTYTNAFVLTNDSFFSGIVDDILEYISRDMTHTEGGFYSAEDADSYPAPGDKHKAEGAFYAWKKSEIEAVLGSAKVHDKKLTDIFEWRYGVREVGNVDPRQDPHEELKGKNVIYIAHTIEETAKHFGVSNEDIQIACEEAKSLLFEYRNKTRPRPGLDTKFLASWNGLMISAFARAGAALENPSYVQKAVEAMNFVNKYLLNPEGDIFRSCYRNGDSNSSPIVLLDIPILGCVDDFANLISANLDLFDATGDLQYLQRGIELQQRQNEIFLDSESGGYFNSRLSPNVIVRFKDDDDGAEPSSNSISAVNLIRLHCLTDNSEYEDIAKKIFLQFGDRLTKVPMSLPLMTSAYQAYSEGTKLILVMKKSDVSSNIVKHLRNRLLPLGSTMHLRNRLLPLGSTMVVLDNEKISANDQWKTLIPCLVEKLEEFNNSSNNSNEAIYLKQGKSFTHTYSGDEFADLINTL
ncbi:unnamed protein product [Allacma fusca]|uniref:Spermatogenesis-associated protein 20-like TRX domain-containing protein n=1 Tax=Allacma fusca TaxID=39272 RepID=A0A8J2PXC6_9HEXA|nr:unnamed protein product [Allacma fusca]